MNEKVSVIIPFYSHKEWLEEAISSVVAQTHKNIEIIVINDGSAEDVRSLIDKYKGKIVYLEQANRGAAAARNRGIEAATGEYIAFLDADDLWIPEKTEVQLKEIKRFEAKWIHSGYNRFGAMQQEKYIDNSWFVGQVFPKIFARNPIATPCVMVEASLLKDNSELRFKEEYRYGEDAYLWTEIAKWHKLYCVAKPLVKVRMHGTNAAQSVFAQLESREQTYSLIKSGKYNDISGLYKVAFKLSHIAYFITRPGRFNSQFVAKLMYAPAWLLFRIIAKV